MTRRLWTLAASVGLALGGLIAPAAVGAAGPNVLTAQLSGAHEVPPVATAGTGSASVTISGDGSSISYQVTYSGLSGPVVASHIHFGAIGANGPIIFPFTAGPSPMSGTLTAATFTGAGGLTYAQALDAIRTGGTYVNVHTAANPGGEIRGQLYDASVPQSYTVFADAPQAVPAGHNWEITDFFPRTLKVASGSTVKFDILGFHTATLLPAGTSAAQDLVTNALGRADADDTSLNVNGSTHMEQVLPNILNILPTATCGTDASPCDFNGTQVVSTGISLGPPPAGPGPPSGPAIRITAPAGTYVVHCRVHPAMIGSLTVVAQGELGASPDDVAAARSAQVAADVADGNAAMAAAEGWATRVNNTSSHTKHAWVGYETPDHWVGILEMIPARLKVHAGDKVQWHLRGRNAAHTVTFPSELGTENAVGCEGAGGTDAQAVPAHTPPQGPGDFNCPAGSTLELEFGGGNGVSTISSPTTVSDSGWLSLPVFVNAFGGPATAMLHTWAVRFSATATPGTYHYVCQVHQGMQGVVVVGG